MFLEANERKTKLKEFQDKVESFEIENETDIAELNLEYMLQDFKDNLYRKIKEIDYD